MARTPSRAVPRGGEGDIYVRGSLEHTQLFLLPNDRSCIARARIQSSTSRQPHPAFATSALVGARLTKMLTDIHMTAECDIQNALVTSEANPTRSSTLSEEGTCLQAAGKGELHDSKDDVCRAASCSHLNERRTDARTVPRHRTTDRVVVLGTDLSGDQYRTCEFLASRFRLGFLPRKGGRTMRRSIN